MNNKTLREEYDHKMELIRQCQNKLKVLIEQGIVLTDPQMLDVSRACDTYAVEIYRLSEQLRQKEA